MKPEKNETGKVKVCPECKTPFKCNPNDCWCSNLPQKVPMFDNGDCYCKNCMEQKLDEKMGTAM